MKRRIIMFSSLIGLSSFSYAQIGINTANPSTSLDIVAFNATGTSNNVDGLLAPRVDRARAQSMASVPAGTIIYVNDVATGTAGGQTVNVTAVGYYYFEAGVWQRFSTPAGVSAQSWGLTGNAGTTPGTNYLGTSDNQNVIFKRNNVQSGMLSATNTAFGVNSIPITATGAGNTALGTTTLSTVTTGTGNTALGTTALSTVTTGSRNVGIGSNAARGITTGSTNVAIGANTLQSTSAAAVQRNIAIGDNALFNNVSGNSNISIGINTGTAITTASNNLLIGDTAGGIQLNGDNNVAIGTNSGGFLTTGTNNVILGSSAGTNITTGAGNIAIGNATQVPTATASNQMNIGNLVFGTGMNGTLAAPAGNIGINQSAPARKLDVNAAAAPIRVSNLQAIATASPNTTVPLILDTTTGDIYQGRPSELLIFNSNYIPNGTPVTLNATATASATGSLVQSIYNVNFTLSRPAIVSIFNSTSVGFTTATGAVITDGSPRLSVTWVRISDSTGATTIQDNLGLASVGHNNTVSATSNLTGNYHSASNPMLTLPTGTYRLDIIALIGCSSGQSVRGTYGSGNDNLYVRADYF
ncbi:hypothetical protein VUJ46_22705 [Chryseobacterium sp. MYb264]|uniref:beta strand repeat-containing protein n=1 Tax=Chryseobacterium sp. MYb264 TaxID=2745153 RepID=UPI002E13C260|nr:hypothetical protein VUJ46_22705 [Chryseobacterium sp. MYb264]